MSWTEPSTKHDTHTQNYDFSGLAVNGGHANELSFHIVKQQLSVS